MSSATDASMRAREKSSSSRPSMTDHRPAAQVQGKPQISPSGMSYEPSEATPIDTQRPPLPLTQSATWSIAALAAEPALEAPRASMIAAPRLPTLGRKSFSIQAWSSTTAAACVPFTLAWNRLGYIVGEWFPHTPMSVTSVTAAPTWEASWATARLWSRRIIDVKRSRGMSGALRIAIRQLVLAGLPTTSTRTSSAARSLSALPCTVKILPFSESSSARSMPLVRGRDVLLDRGEELLRRLPGLIFADEQREVFGHLAAFHGLHADSLERLRKGADVGGLVDAPARRQPPRPSEDRRNRVGRRRLSLLVLAVVTGDGPVRGLGLDRLAVGAHQPAGHQPQRADALGHAVALRLPVAVR